MSWHFSYVSFALKWACTSRSGEQVSDLIPYIPLHSTPKPQVREAGHHTKERTEDQACAGALDEGGRREVRVWRQFHTPFCPTLGATFWQIRLTCVSLRTFSHWNRYKSGQNHLTDYIGVEPSKKRKRRTSFTPQALELLNAHFERNTHPSGEW